MRTRRFDREFVEMRERLVGLETSLAKLETLLIVRDPGSALSADAYDALRRTVMFVAKSRRSHIGHLVSLKDAVQRGLSLEAVGHRIEECLSELGLEYITDLQIDGAFEVIGGEGDLPEIVEPALVEVTDGQVTSVVRLGKIRLSRSTPDPVIDKPGEDSSIAPGSPSDEVELDTADTTFLPTEQVITGTSGLSEPSDQ